MNKNIKILIVSLAVLAGVVVVAAAAGVGVALAQDPTPTPEFGPGWMMGGYRQSGQDGETPFGMMGRSGMMGRYRQSGQDEDGWEWMQAMHGWMSSGGGMHAAVWQTLTEKLGMTSDELYAELWDGGKTLTQVAEEKGVSSADLAAALEAAHQQSMDQAVADGVLTQEQADSILANMAGRYVWMLDNMGAGSGAGYGPGAGGCRGMWNSSTDDSQSKP